jgi:hypothetical protein
LQEIDKGSYDMTARTRLELNLKKSDTTRQETVTPLSAICR